MITTGLKRILPIVLSVLNIIMILILFLSVSYAVRHADHLAESKDILYRLSSQSPETQGNLSLEKGRSEKYEYIRDWHNQDRKNFEQLLNNPIELKDETYKQYIALCRKLSELEKKAYHDPKGYTLYSPLLTEAHNVLTLAVNARARLLTDTPFESLQNDRRVSDYYGQQIDYYKHFHYVDGLISPAHDFVDYDQEIFVRTLNELPLPNHYYDRLRVFFSDFNSPVAGGATLLDVRGNKDIVMFNNNYGIDQLQRALVHEIGHVADNEILFSYQGYNEEYLSKQENQKAMLEYAQIYGKKEYSNQHLLTDRSEWGDSLRENFAEDFAFTYMDDYSKASGWEGNHGAEVKAFIENKMALSSENEFSQFSGAKIIFRDDKDDYKFDLRNDELNIFYTKNNGAVIQLEKPNRKGQDLQASMGLADQDLLTSTYRMNAQHQIEVNFPREGDQAFHTVRTVRNSSDIPLLSALAFGNDPPSDGPSAAHRWRPVPGP